MSTIMNTNDQLDITGAKDVQIQIRGDQRVIWVNVDGMCRLRICQIEDLTIDDQTIYVMER